MLACIAKLQHTLKYLAIILCSLALSLIASCGKPSPAEQAAPPNPSNAKSSANSVDFVSYNNNGLSLSYPKHWKFSFDDSPSLYADRGVGFNATEFSNAFIYILNDKTLDTDVLSNRFIKELKLETGEHIENYKRSPIQVGQFKGEQLTFRDTMLIGSTETEITIVKLPNTAKSVFAVFNLSDEDIKTESIYSEHFTNSISLK